LLQYSEDANQHGVTYGYDPTWGALTSTSRTVFKGKGLIAITASKSYDPQGRLQTETDENDATTKYYYDLLSRTSHIDHPNGAYEFFDYRNWGDPKQQSIQHLIGPDPGGPTADDNVKRGEASAQFFDGFGQVYMDARSSGDDNGAIKNRIIVRTRNESF